MPIRNLGEKSMHVISFVSSNESGHDLFVFIHAPIGQQVGIAWQKKCTDMKDDVGAKFWVSLLQHTSDLRVPKQMCLEYIYIYALQT